MAGIRYLFIILSILCSFQVIFGFLDLHKYFESQLIRVIHDENLNCANYNAFCDRSLEQFQNNVDATETSANEMAIELCKALLREYLCVHIPESVPEDVKNKIE